MPEPARISLKRHWILYKKKNSELFPHLKKRSREFYFFVFSKNVLVNFISSCFQSLLTTPRQGSFGFLIDDFREKIMNFQTNFWYLTSKCMAFSNVTEFRTFYDVLMKNFHTLMMVCLKI